MEAYIPCLVFFFICAVGSHAGYVSITELTDPSKYNLNEKPNIGSDNPVIVRVCIEMRNIEYLNEGEDKIFSLEFFVKQSWTDNRLIFPDTADNKYITTSKENVIWLPDTAFTNEREYSIFHNLRFIQIFRNGTVRSHMSLKIKALAMRRPHAKSAVNVRLISLNSTQEELSLMWDEYEPIKLQSDLHMGWYYTEALTLDDFKTGHCNSSGIARLKTPKYGNYSCIYFEVCKGMSVSLSFLTVYLPSTLCVFLSWASFWMDKKSTLGRSLLPLLAFIHLLNQKVVVMNDTLVVKYPVTLNTWIYGCIIMVAAALLQVVVVSYLYGSSIERYHHVCRSESPKIRMLQERREEESSLEDAEEQERRPRNKKARLFLKRWLPCFSPSAADVVNAIARWLFPIAFIILSVLFILETR